MNRRDRQQLVDLAVASAQESHKLHPGQPLARHVRVALNTYQAGVLEETPEPVVPVAPEPSTFWRWTAVASVLSALIGFAVGYAS